MEPSLLQIKNLEIRLRQSAPENGQIVSDLNLTLREGRILALVGASGSGKSTTALSIVQLVNPAMQVTKGEILFEGEDILKKTAAQMRHLRGAKIGMVFQEPLSALNPLFTIGFQVMEVLEAHLSLSRRQRQTRALELFSLAGIPDPRRIFAAYPHQLSGGLRQRAMIAQAIAAGPKLLIADEPTSNLDVTIQAHILDLFRALRKDLNLAVLLITHDLGVVRELSDEMAVLFRGVIVEEGPVAQVFASARHAFTVDLLQTIQD